MAAWAALNDYVLSDFEVEAIKAMDCAYVDSINKVIRDRTQR
jgi:hypothetical protein